MTLLRKGYCERNHFLDGPTWQGGFRMRILFLPNFVVLPPSEGEYKEGYSKRPGSGEIGYWFFKYFPDADVEILQKTSPFPFNKLSDLLGFEVYQGFRAFMKQSDYDLVVSHSYNSGFVFSLLRSLICRRDPPHIVIDVGSLNGGSEQRWQIALIRFALRSVSGLVYHSRVNEGFYSKHFPEVKRGFVFFGTETDYFSPLPEEPTNAYALSMGVSHRDYETLIRAWAGIEFPLKIVGHTQIDTAGLENVELVPKVSIPEFKRYIHNARIVILPFKNVRYSIGQMTLTECMSMGKPIVVSRSFGVLDYVEDGVDCLTYACGDPKDLSDKVSTLLRDPALASRLGAAARAEALLKFNEEAMGLGISEFVRSATSGKDS